MPEPSDADREAARAAGRALAARGLVGLVLGGGGAKGAYEIGCWRALRECGLSRFGAVAGTSVGALNAVLVAQDDFDRAEALWRDMRAGRVLRLRWHTMLALAIRLVLLVPYLGKYVFPARAIPVSLWRAVRRYRHGMAEDGDPRHLVRAALDLYTAFLRRPDATDLISQLVLAAIVLAGWSAWWIAAAPLITIAASIVLAPLIALLVVSYASAFAAMLDQLSTRLVLASNEPLHALLHECVDVDRLRRREHPLFVTLASLREVERASRPRPARIGAAPAGAVSPIALNREAGGDGPEAADRDFRRRIVGALPIQTSMVEYVPTHFDVTREDPARIHDLILQSAGLPEIFPARRFDGDSYVDGGIVDNEPLAALAGLGGHELVVVITLDSRKDEACVRADCARNLERLGRSPRADLPPLLVLRPSRPLGNMLTGTLNFSARRARRLMHEGYCDTMALLASDDARTP